MNTLVPSSDLKDFKNPNKVKFKFSQMHPYDIIIAQQSLPTSKNQQFFPIVDVSKKFEESLEKCRKKRKAKKIIKAIEKVTISKQLSQNIIENYRKIQTNDGRIRCTSESNEINEFNSLKNRRASELVDELLLDIYGRTNFCPDKVFETEYGSSTSFKSLNDKFNEKLQYSRLILKDVTELSILIGALKERVTYAGNLLVKQLKKRDALKSKQEKICNVITAHLHAYSDKTSEDTNMRFSPNPIPGDSGFNQWRDAMKMVAKLPGGIPPEFRRKLWIALAEKHLQSKGVNWSQTERLCFNEWSNPDDSELGIQIVKDLHRTGCSLFCGAAGQENQALLKRVLLAYARWNKSVGYCQGFNMLAALILQVMDKNETDSVKVMIYLIEGVLPESYFANNLRGLSVDMIVFRDLLKMRLPVLSKHLEALQNDAREGNSYEPPLTNVFTMQWFLTLFCNCLPQATVLRVWDLIFLEGNEILLRTAIAIWEKLSDRILAVNSADEFYSIMGVLTREMLEFGLVDSNTLIKSIVAIGTCSELNEMRDKYLYNITPWTQSVQTAAKKGFKLFYSDDDDVESDFDEKAAVTAAYGISIGRKREKQQNSKEGTVIQPYAYGHPDRERLALDISALKKQYSKLRERQRQAHIILQAACARQPMGQNSNSPPIAMNHLLLGKSAIVNSRGRRLGPPKGSIPPARTKKPEKQEPIKKKAPVITGETILWKDTAKFRRRQSIAEETDTSQETFMPESDSSSYSEDGSSSTSTELCDEHSRMSDFDSDDKFNELDVATDHSVLPAVANEKDNNLGEFSCEHEVSELFSNINEQLKCSDFSKASDVEFRDFQCTSSDLLPNTEENTNLTLITNINEPLKTSISSEISDIEFSDFQSKSSDFLPDINLASTEKKLQNEFSDFQSKSSDFLPDINLASTEKKLQNEFSDFQSKSSDFLPDINLASTEKKLQNEFSDFQVKVSDEEATTIEENVVSLNEFSSNILQQVENEEIIEDNFDVFLEERVKILKENSAESLSSPKEESTSLRTFEDKLRRHKSFEETSKNQLEKIVISKQNSFDISSLPTIETSLWTPYRIDEESPKETTPTEPKKPTSVDLLQVEDKRLEAGRRNSERALKIIQENSLILHRILQQQKSSEKEDSEDELSRSPISRTFLRSESLLSKDEKTDEERSSKDGDEELESGVESFSVSPALIDEESDRSLKKDQFEDEETMIISYKYHSDVILSSQLDYSKDKEDVSSSTTQSDNKYSKIEENLEQSPYRFSFKYKEESEDNLQLNLSCENEEKHERLLTFLSNSPNGSSIQRNEELDDKSTNLIFEERPEEKTVSHYYEELFSSKPDDKTNEHYLTFEATPEEEKPTEYSDYLSSYLKSEDKSTEATKEEMKTYLKDSIEDIFRDCDNSKSFDKEAILASKEDVSSYSKESSSPFKYRFREDSDDNINKSQIDSKYNLQEDISSKHEEISSNFTYKYSLESPDYQKDTKTEEISYDSSTFSINTNTNLVSENYEDNNIFQSCKPEYNKSNLSIDLSLKIDDFSPEVSPPKNLSCLQFSSFQTDIPCSSKSIQFPPICTKNIETSPQPTSPTKTTPKYYTAFNLPTLSPPRRTVKSPLSPNRAFSPFPVQPTTRQPKELGVKLGMYKDLSPSPTK